VTGCSVLHFVIGLPGPFATWCETALDGVARHAGVPMPVLQANTPDELARAVIRSGGSHAIVSSHSPGGQLRAALVDSQSPFLLVLDDPRRVLMALTTDGMDFFAALRLVASACAVLRDCAGLPAALVLRAGTPAPESMTAIARHMAFALSPQDTAMLMPPPAAAQDMTAVHSWWNGLPPWARSAAEGALGPYESASQSGMPVRWESDLFWRGERPEAPLDGAIDITGRGRVLLSGPGIVMPHGGWRLTVRLHVSEHAVQRDFLLEAVAGKVLAACEMTPSRPGLYEAQARIVIDTSVDHPVLVRLSLKRAAFDGEIALDSVVLAPERV